ncbi:MAG: penicillin acylase family protein, partial [Candidatus Hydrogenedentes bacterium]|nr:penicillin acylase family protein [Candidatus Hydrogenedentota bacterium]
PPSGYIVTANNKSSVRAFGPIESLTGYWQPWDRAERIESQLDTREKWSIDDTKRLQTDGVGVTSKEIIATVAKVLESEKENLSTTENELVMQLKDWDGNHDPSSNLPTVYTYLCDAILDRTVADELGPDNFKIYAGLGEAWCFLHYVVQRDNSPFWDDRATPGHIETRAEIFVSAMHLAMAKITEKHGSDHGNWRWGKDHTMTFMHPLGFIPVIGAIFNIGPFEAPGGSQTINNLLHPHGTFDHKIIAGPSTRRIIDFADPEHSYTILPTGNSGHWLDPHYADQARMFINGEYREVVLTKEQIAASTTKVLQLAPK